MIARRTSIFLLIAHKIDKQSCNSVWLLELNFKDQIRLECENQALNTISKLSSLFVMGNVQRISPRQEFGDIPAYLLYMLQFSNLFTFTTKKNILKRSGNKPNYKQQRD